MSEDCVCLSLDCRFYGRPWLSSQRVDLFNRMSEWGMNTYLYAPKDDDKHRASWRDLYSLEEAEQLSHLLLQASSRGIIFIYAIAPGLDMTFSSSQEISLLKRKLDQVSALGCNSFAILFDDIDTDLCPADDKMFSSFAHAQVATANELYCHLDRPNVFLFCPTEYCESRAVPSVAKSQYLQHIGAELDPGIDIMWTGPKVISKTISLSSIQELSGILRRPPVLWDNLHANDYDQRRLFLGPYSGRSVSLRSHLNGVLTNPNCEFSANYIAIHTLAQWSRSSLQLCKKPSPTPTGISVGGRRSGKRV
ncbi:Protein O-GlcNAcase [Geodia barretti]|uniref:protein O-GlcNAcase n=1 Tax=Geodia barretti TaxID=519541 RepID=A0AA35W790_GEOBA|nr:Protein O-GlcNAcase [Geodia barretti]